MFGAAGPSLKGKSLSDQHSGLAPCSQEDFSNQLNTNEEQAKKIFARCAAPTGRRPGNGWESGWRVGVRASRPRRFREAKTSRKPPVFHNLQFRGAAASRTSGSHAMLVQKVLRHFRGCGILPRPSGWIEECLTQSPPSPPSVRAGSGGRESTRMSRMPPRIPGWLGDGRDVYIENQENRFADRNAWRANGGRPLGQLGTLLQGTLAKPEGGNRG